MNIETTTEALELRASLGAAHGAVYTTKEATELFAFHSFMAPLVYVTEKATQRKGWLQFVHSPRFYFNFVEEKESNVF